MEIHIEKYTKDKIQDVLQFEKDLRSEEDFWGWKIDDDYELAVENSFDDPSFKNALSFLAYADNKVIGRIDASLIVTHFDGSIKAYLDWICVLKSYRHLGAAQALMKALRNELKQKGVDTLIGLIASNKEAQSFYRSLEESTIKDEGIWIDIK